MNLFFAPSRKLAAHRLAHGGPRIYDPRERVLLAGADALLRGASWLTGLRPARDFPDVRSEMAHYLDTLGVDGVITDNPDQMPRRPSTPR